MARVSLFVLDTGPLIILAAAENLDYLLYPNVPVVIPDAVFYEATRDVGKLGAQSTIDWVKAHHTQVEIAPTNAYVNFQAARSVNPRAEEPHLVEQAAVEVIDEPARLQGDERAVSLFEETNVMRRVVVRERERIIEVSTMDFLRILEAEQRIQSADAVFDRALAAGRSPSRAEKLKEYDAELREAVRETLRAAPRLPGHDQR